MYRGLRASFTNRYFTSLFPDLLLSARPLRRTSFSCLSQGLATPLE